MVRPYRSTGQELRWLALMAGLFALAVSPSSVAGASPGVDQVADDGAIVVAFADADTLTWSAGTSFQRYQVYRGDLALLRSGGIYTQNPATTPAAAHSCQLTATSTDDTYVPAVGTVVFYFVTGWNDGIEWGLGADSTGRPRPNDNPCPCGRPFTTVLHEHLTDGPPSQRRMIDNLPDWCAFLPSQCNTGLVDFTTEVALVSARLAGNSCTDTVITCVEDAASAEDLTVYVEDIDPGNCTCFPIVLSPVFVAKMPRPVTSAGFVATTVPRVCP